MSMKKMYFTESGEMVSSDTMLVSIFWYKVDEIKRTKVIYKKPKRKHIPKALRKYKIKRKNMKELMINKDISTSHLSDIIGCSQNTVISMLRGDKMSFTANEVATLEKVFNMPIKVIITLEQDDMKQLSKINSIEKEIEELRKIIINKEQELFNTKKFLTNKEGVDKNDM